MGQQSSNIFVRAFSTTSKSINFNNHGVILSSSTNDNNDNNNGISRRNAIGTSAYTFLGSIIGTTTILGSPISVNAASSNAPTQAELQRIVDGYKAINAFIDNFDENTTA